MEISKNLKINSSEKILDKAFRRANNVRVEKENFEKIKPYNYRIYLYEKEKAITKISTYTNIIKEELNHILKSYPMYKELSPFYKELIKNTISLPNYKKALRSISWANKSVIALSNQCIENIKNMKTSIKNKSVEEIKKEILRELKSFYGRASSFIKDIREDIKFLMDVKDQIKRFPDIQEDKHIFIGAGMPNVGKSSLINALCSGNIEVNYYPFTTKDIKIGKLENIAQIIDTPGVMEKSVDEMNDIEMKAFIAITKLRADIIFVFDTSLSSGYSLDEQIMVEKSMQTALNSPDNKSIKWIYIINKIDIKDREVYIKLKEYLKGKEYFEVSSKENQGIKELKNALIKRSIGILSKKERSYRIDK